MTRIIYVPAPRKRDAAMHKEVKSALTDSRKEAAKAVPRVAKINSKRG